MCVENPQTEADIVAGLGACATQLSSREEATASPEYTEDISAPHQNSTRTFMNIRLLLQGKTCAD